ncbi:MAG: hypothetical protein E7017_04200 [Alphaproteobacteria bacterium]|nr:hypothetical protein [Alphaproteobacteria bacterium]
MKKYLFINLLAAVFCANSVLAAEQRLLGEYGDWVAYYYRDSAGPVCYMASTPKKDEGKYSKRGDIYVVVTHRPNEKSYDVVNVNAGYPYKRNSETQLKIGAKTFNLFTSGDKAWAMTSQDDKEIVNSMKRGSRMIVNGTSSKGTKTKDTYSLSGFTSAYKAISNKCK